MADIYKVFDNIYENKKWGNRKETLSGGGSTKEINKFRIPFLKKFIEDYKITNIVPPLAFTKHIFILKKVFYLYSIFGM